MGIVEFVPGTKGVTVRVTLDAETTYSEEQQRQGWQAILNNFAKHVVASGNVRQNSVTAAGPTIGAAEREVGSADSRDKCGRARRVA